MNADERGWQALASPWILRSSAVLAQRAHPSRGPRFKTARFAPATAYDITEAATRPPCQSASLMGELDAGSTPTDAFHARPVRVESEALMRCALITGTAG
jgi:hypothetical protein